MRELLKRLRFVLRPAVSVLFFIKVLRPKVIIMIDGGICSQIMQYLFGRIFAEKGMQVVYDIEFYKKWGKDADGKFERNFDLQKILPDIEVPFVSKIERRLYSFLYSSQEMSFNVIEENKFDYLQSKPPVFLAGYYTPPKDLWLNLFPKYILFNKKCLDEVSTLLLQKIQYYQNSIAIHVRRGDLSVEVVGYGKPLSVSYFKAAINYFIGIFSDPHFFFFSDEPIWIEENILSEPLRSFSTVVSSNDSTKGYMDLILISECKHQVTSRGSLGKFGALANKNVNKKVIFHNDAIEKVWKDIFSENAVFLDETYE